MTTMDCFPTCEVSLGEIGSASVRSKFEICQNPPLLTLSVKSGGKITSSSFVAGNEIEVRPIRSSLRQLNLHVQFTKNNATGVHQALAGFENIKTGNITYFMNNTLNADASLCSDANRNNQTNSDFLWVLLCIILITCLLFVGISLFTIMSKFNSSQKSSSRKRSNVSIEKTALPRRNNNQCTVMISEANTYLLSPNYYNDERLAVIAEVDEKDQISEASLSCRESSNSLCQKLEQERRKLSSESTKTKTSSSLALTPTAQKTSFIYQKDQVILPQNLNYARRNSQPLIFPTSNSLESIKTKPQLATFAL